MGEDSVSLVPVAQNTARVLLPFCFVLAYIMLELVWVNLASLTPYFLLSRLLSWRASLTLYI